MSASLIQCTANLRASLDSLEARLGRQPDRALGHLREARAHLRRAQMTLAVASVIEAVGALHG